MMRTKTVLVGFFILFVFYHFPEFFDSFTIAAIFKITFLIVAVIVARLQGFKGLGNFGLAFKEKWLRHLILGLLIGCLAFTVSVLLSIGLNFEAVTKIQPFSFFIKNLPFVLLVTFFPSIAEDILTRGYLWAHLKFLNPLTWTFISAAVYVLNHIWRLNEGLPVLSYLFFLGLVLAISVWITRSLWLTLGIHWGANIVFEMVHSGIRTTSVADSAYPTYCLAATWLFVFILLLVIDKNEKDKKSD